MRELGNEMQLVEEFKQYLVLEEKSKAMARILKPSSMENISEEMNW